MTDDDWGLPDWRDGAAYPHDLTDRQWWWQFTRRRPDYRGLWLEHRPSEEMILAAGPDARCYPPDRHSLYLNFQLNALLDPRREYSNLELSCHRRSLNGTAPVSTGVRREALNEALALFDDLGPGYVKQALEEATNQSAAAENAGVMLYSFDLSKPLPDQILAAEKTLEFWQERRFGKLNPRRPHDANWSLYLRALDAKEERATFAMMASQFWPGQQKTPQSARDTHKAATALRDNFPR